MHRHIQVSFFFSFSCAGSSLDCVQAFSSCVEWGLLFVGGALLFLQTLGTCASVVVVCRLSCPAACRILVPGPGLEPVSPALAGRFLTTGPPEKSPSMYLQVKVTQSCLTLCDPMDCSPPGSSVHGISQARILEWVAFPFSRGSSQPGIEPGSPALQADSLPTELSGKLYP